MKKIIAALSVIMMLTACGEAMPSNTVTPKPTNSPTNQVITPFPTQKSNETTTSTATNTQQPSSKIEAKIIRVVDGDTMEVSINGKKETIRLLLVDTPETVDPNEPVQPFGPEASSFAKETLNGKDVQIEIDVSERDKYGRLLCYLWIGNKMFNELLLEKGLARVAYIYPPNVKYVDQFQSLQKKAQTSAVGIWSIENYAKEDGFHEEVAVASKKPVATPTPKPTPVPTPSTAPAQQNVYYKNCTAARAAGAAPIYRGEPGYRAALDRDNDGVACE